MRNTEFLTKANGGHDEAAYAQREIYGQVIEQERKVKAALSVLDFGCGECGTGRVMLEPMLRNAHDRLALYDRDPKIAPPIWSNASIVGEEEIFGTKARDFDIINLSYVLCTMEPNDAMQTLRNLVLDHPESRFVIIDYVLKGRERNAVLGMLHADAELRWQEKLGQDEFVRTHTRYDMQSLLNIVRYGGIPAEPQDARYLDSFNMRAAIVTKSVQEANVNNPFAFLGYLPIKRQG